MLLIRFTNDGSGTEEIGNYTYTVSVNYYKIADGRIENHKRSDGWRGLVGKLLNEPARGDDKESDVSDGRTNDE